jgi:hypothetical protein
MSNFFIGLVNLIIKAIGAVLQGVSLILPSSPFTILDNSPIAEYLPTLNYFIPVNSIISILELWLTAVSVYYVSQIILRWLKAIG